MVYKFNISFIILCRIIRCNVLNLAFDTKRIGMGAREQFRHFLGLRILGLSFFWGRQKSVQMSIPVLNFIECPPESPTTASLEQLIKF